MEDVICKGWVISRLEDGFFWDSRKGLFCSESMTVFETWNKAENVAKVRQTNVSVWPVLVESVGTFER